MTGRRILYLAGLCLSLGIYIVNGQWISRMLLLTLLLLPVLSFLLSLKTMLGAELTPDAPKAIVLGNAMEVELWGPAAPFRVKCRKTEGFSDKQTKARAAEAFVPKHCGRVTFSVQKAWVYDSMGLFRMRIRNTEPVTTLVMPKPIAPDRLPPLERSRVKAWRVKPGGGFAENHELRLYRPGDPLNQIHWKLSAKTGTTVLREPMEPRKGRYLLQLELSGQEDALDAKLGELLYASTWLLEQALPHEVHALTGEGLLSGKITDTSSQTAFFRQLLKASPVTGEERLEPVAADWLHRIGGYGYGK